jgi:ribosome-binding factor A
MPDHTEESHNSRQDKLNSFIKELSATFLAKIDNKTSLITVTSCRTSPDAKNATVYITVLPESKEASALGFIKRHRGDLRDFLKQHMQTKVIPFIDVEIDKGEKNRQKIDELLRNG